MLPSSYFWTSSTFGNCVVIDSPRLQVCGLILCKGIRKLFLCALLNYRVLEEESLQKNWAIKAFYNKN